jgi:hypothetical protein
MRIINVAVTDHRLSIRYRFSRKGIAAVVDHARALKENPSSLVEAVVMSGVRDAARIPRADYAWSPRSVVMVPIMWAASAME